MKEGYYYLKRTIKTKKGIKIEKSLVQGYRREYFDGKFVFGFNTLDGGGVLPLDEITKNTEIIPVAIVEKKSK